MYLHHILKRPKTELIRKFYDAQRLKPSKNDWVIAIDNDKKDFEIKYSDCDIGKMSKNKFRDFLETRIKKFAFEYLMRKKGTHSKIKDLVYTKLDCQNYLKYDFELNNEDKMLLFKFRTRMIDMKNNFKNNYADLRCQLG